MVIVTGADGFIGSHMVKYLRSKGLQVRAVGSKRDLTNSREVEYCLAGGSEVYHFAARHGGIGYISDPLVQFELSTNNMRADLNVIEYCKQRSIKLFYPSSACIYPDLSTPLKETDRLPAHAQEMYGWEKLYITELSAYVPLMRVGILHTIYGEGQAWEGSRAKYPTALSRKLLEAIKTGSDVKLWGTGEQKRTFLYIDDAVEMMCRVMTMPYTAPVNISHPQSVSVKETAEQLARDVGFEGKIVFDPTAPVGRDERGADTSRFFSEYQYTPLISPREGFKKVFVWLQNHLVF